MWFPHHHWMYPLNTAHAQSVAKSCLMKIHFVLFQNTSALPASNNHSAITLSWLRGEQDTKGLFVGGCVAFLSPSSCSVKFSVSLKISLYLSSLRGASPAPSWCSAEWMGSSLSLWAAAILVPWPCCQHRAQQRIRVGWRREVTQFGGSAVNVCDRTCPLSCAGAATGPGPTGLQPCLFSHFMREKQ